MGAIMTEETQETQTQYSEPAIQETSAISQPQASTSGLAIASLVLGILSMLCCGILTCIPGIICGHMGIHAVNKSEGKLTGKGMAIAGLILSYASLLLTLLGLVFLILYFVMFFKILMGAMPH